MLLLSVDSVFSHKAWQEQELVEMVDGGARWPMLSDLGGKIGKAYGVYDKAAGVDQRSYFLIDPDGVLQAMSVIASGVGHNIDEILRQIKAAQHVRETGEVTPSGWQPGAPALQAGANRVGKVWEVWKPKQ